jgi:hypothetical protein
MHSSQLVYFFFIFLIATFQLDVTIRNRYNFVILYIHCFHHVTKATISESGLNIVAIHREVNDGINRIAWPDLRPTLLITLKFWSGLCVLFLEATPNPCVEASYPAPKN